MVREALHQSQGGGVLVAQGREILILSSDDTYTLLTKPIISLKTPSMQCNATHLTLTTMKNVSAEEMKWLEPQVDL